MRDSRSPDVAWLYERLEAMGRPDCSDSGMVYFLLSGNEQPTVQGPQSTAARPRAGGDRCSGQPSGSKPRIFNSTTTRFPTADWAPPFPSEWPPNSPRESRQAASARCSIELYAPSGRYDIEVRYFDAKEGRCELSLFVGGVQQGESWTASSHSGNWQTQTIANVAVNAGDEIMVKVQAEGKQTGGLDYVQLNKTT